MLHNLDVLKDDLKREYTELGVTLNYLFRVSELGKTLSVDMPIHKVKKNVNQIQRERLILISIQF